MINKLSIVFSAHRMYMVTMLMLGLSLAGCAAPYDVTKVSPQESYNLSVEKVLGTGKISVTAKDVLQRYNLLDMLSEDPITTIQDLHDIVKIDERRDILFALPELSYLWAELFWPITQIKIESRLGICSSSQPSTPITTCWMRPGNRSQRHMTGTIGWPVTCITVHSRRHFRSTPMVVSLFQGEPGI